MDQEQPELKVVEGNVSDEMLAPLTAFMVNNKDRIEQYYKNVPKHAPLPIVWDAAMKQWYWKNRKLRREERRRGKLKNGRPRYSGRRA